MKVSNYHFVLFMLLCKFRPILPRSQKVFSTTFIGYFCALLLQLCFCYYGFDFLSRFLLETKESESMKLHGNRKGSDRIYHVCMNFHFILGVNTDYRRIGLQLNYRIQGKFSRYIRWGGSVARQSRLTSHRAVEPLNYGLKSHRAAEPLKFIPIICYNTY